MEIIPSVAGGVLLIIVLVIIWLRVRRRRRNDEYPPLLGDNGRGVVEISQNEFPDRSDGSELTLRRGPTSLTKPFPTGSTCSDIAVPKKDNLNNKIKPYVDDLC